jgi:hypothetical protein
MMQFESCVDKLAMPNKADAPNAAMALWFHSVHRERGVGDLRRWALVADRI